MRTMEFPGSKTIDYFLSQHRSWQKTQTVCIGTRSGNLRETLMLSGLPAQLTQAYPGLKIYTAPFGMNRAVFKNNPHISGWRLGIGDLFGDELTSQLESLQLRPELHLTEAEIGRSQRFIRNHILYPNDPQYTRKPLCLLHAWGSDHRKEAEVEFWDEMVSRWKGHFRFWQVGLMNDSAIQGCEYYFLLPRRNSNLRRLMALTSQARAFIGIDAAPRYIAQAFSIPSLVFCSARQEGDASSEFEISQRFTAQVSQKKVDDFLSEMSAQ